MPSFSTNDVVLVRDPFTDLTSAKVRPAVVMSTFPHSPDPIMVPLTGRLTNLVLAQDSRGRRVVEFVGDGFG